MKAAIRNRLAELLLDCFNNAEKRSAVAALAAFCKMTMRMPQPQVPLGELLRKRNVFLPKIAGGGESALIHVIGTGKLLQLRRADTGEVFPGDMLEPVRGKPWLVEPPPDVRAAFRAVCERVRIYADLVARMGNVDVTSIPRDPLRKAMAEAALCFNVGLFFEAHEHLEHHWATQPKGPTRRFLQGIIQISVGFHHAHAGNYQGAVNQLAKGLEKTIGTTGEVLGLDCDAFLPKVAAVREAIGKRGKVNMRPLTLREIPRMAIRG